MKIIILFVFLVVLSCKNNFAQSIDHPNKQRQDLGINPREQIREEEDNTAYKLKLGDNEVPINTHNGLKPNERQIEIIKSTIVDDFLVNDDVGSADQFVPSISMDAVGNFVIVWYDFRNDNWDIYYQRYNNAGTALGVNTKVNDDTEGASQEHPSISMDAAGNFVIVWSDYRNNNNYDIYYQRYTSTGGALGVNTKVNDDAGNADQIAPSILIDVAGNFVIVWHDFRNANWDIYYQRYTSTGGALGVNTKVNDDAGGEFQMFPKISMDVTGNFVIVWQDYRNNNYDIYYQRYTSTGTALGANIKVNDDAGSMNQVVSSISMDGVGNFVIVWQDDRYGQTDHDIIGQRYFSNGNPNGGNYLIVANGPNNKVASPVVYADNSNIIFSWQDNRRSEDFSLSQNYPNPFNPNTKIKYQIPELSFINIKVYDVLGIEVATLVNEQKPAGEYEVEFSGNGLTSGIYFYQIKAGDFIQTKKMILLR